MYHYGSMSIKEARYISVSFSDHHSLIVRAALPLSFANLLTPRSRLPFKANPVVVRDPFFQERLKKNFDVWTGARDRMEFLVWWEEIVKPGIKKLLIQRGKEISQERRGKLNLLLIRQAYLVKKLHLGLFDKMKELKEVHARINDWYTEESEKIKL